MSMERLLSRKNLLSALKRVERNKGSHGVDEMTVQNLRKHILKHLEYLNMEHLQGILRDRIPTDTYGGVRGRGIATPPPTRLRCSLP